MRYFPFSLKLSIPVSLIICSSLLGIMSFNREISATYQRTELSTKNYIQIIGGQTSRIIDYLYRRNNLESTVGTIISQLGNDPNLDFAVVIDDKNTILEANRYELKEQSIAQTELAQYRKEIDSVRIELAGEIILSPDRQKIIAFYPILLEVLPNELRASRVGILLLEYDLTLLKNEAYNSAFRRSLIFNGALAIFCLSLWFFFELTLTRRVSRLVAASHSLAQGNLNIRTELKGSDELAQVSVAFDHMANSIQENTDNLQKELTEKKIIEEKLKATNDELYQRNIELVEATKAKSNFLANMSHEIRTPMNGVIGIAQILAMTELSDEQKDLVHTIRDSGDALITVINDILDFSKIESGNLELENHPLVLSEIIQSVCKLLSQQAAKKDFGQSVQISFAQRKGMPDCFLGDAVRLRQILLNLIGNALKFTHDGEVLISTMSTPIGLSHGGEDNESDHHRQLRHIVTVKIQDSGIGIDGDRLKHLFQPFTQADESISRKYGGTGLGLVICKSLVELMGGTIWVHTKGKIGGYPPPYWKPEIKHNFEHGSTFYFTFIAPEVMLSDRTSYLTQIHHNIALEGEMSSLKILLAEDNRVNQKVALLTLKQLNCRADIANNGREVLQCLEQQNYDIILMDMQMPEMDGVTTTRIIRQSEALVQPYIIALTANALAEDRELCLEVGMDDFLTKPLAIAEINRVLTEYVQFKKNSHRSPKEI